MQYYINVLTIIFISITVGWCSTSRSDAIEIVLNQVLDDDSAFVNIYASIDSIFATDSVRTK